MVELHEVQVPAEPVDRFTDVIGEERTEALRGTARRARETLGDRVVWNVNSTAAGGGVAEMLQVLLAYVRGAGIDTRWVVIEGEPPYYAVTKRLHNRLHGTVGDAGPLDADARAVYERVTGANAGALAGRVRPDDVVVLHDPQTAGLAPELSAAGATVVWRCHIGTDSPNEHTEAAWSFLRTYLEPVDGFVFSRSAHVPAWVPDERVAVIPPSIDPFSAKNQRLGPDTVRAILHRVGLLPGPGSAGAPSFERRDGSRTHVRRPGEFVRAGDAPTADTPLVVQVSRWDRLKDMAGVLRGFAEHVPAPAHLALVGPSVAGVADDPEGAEVLEECAAVWDGLAEEVRTRAHLVALPMEDVEENAAMVNAFQRHAAVVAQKSLQEGFGLTVSEAMLKGRPVVASRTGGIQDQIEHGEHGLLVDDPTDLAAFGGAVAGLLSDPDEARRLGGAARTRVVDEFVGDRHLRQYAELFEALVADG